MLLSCWVSVIWMDIKKLDYQTNTTLLDLDTVFFLRFQPKMEFFFFFLSLTNVVIQKPPATVRIYENIYKVYYKHCDYKGRLIHWHGHLYKTQRQWCRQACHRNSGNQHLEQRLKMVFACSYPVPVDVPKLLSSEPSLGALSQLLVREQQQQ